jgi:hypothetical protein
MYLSILGYLNFNYLSWFLARSSQVESMNLSLNTCSNSSHTIGTLWCNGWSLLRLSIMLRTHKLTFSPLMSVRANVTCQIGDSNPVTPWLSMRYPRNSVRKASALVLSLSKILGSDPMALMSWAWGMGTIFWRWSPLGSSLEVPLSKSSLSGGPPPPPLPLARLSLSRLLKVSMIVARTCPSVGQLDPSWLAPKGMDPPSHLDPLDGWASL